jgi:hypothetical protein
MKVINNNLYCLKVYFHVIRRSNGTGGQNTESVNEAFSILNQDYNPHNISFVWDNNYIDYIDNDTYYSNPTTAIYNINNHQDGIDIYLFDDSSSVGGRANGVGESSEFWVSGSYWKSPFDSLTTSHVISHEMGHVLFLWHTHHGTYNEGGNDNPCPELVNGSNSSTCGDYVEDTPADPHLEFDVNQTTCQWNNNGTDSNGDAYNPDEKLIMSYTDIGCMQYFSPKQGERMRNMINTLPYLQQTISNSCSLIEGPNEICTGDSTTYSLSNIPVGATINWEYPSDSMYIISGQGTANCTFGAFTSGSNNVIIATITVNGNTYFYEKDINILSNTTQQIPSIVIAPDNPFNLTCCGQTYTFSHAVCDTYCNNIEWDFNVYYQDPQDYYSFSNSGNIGSITAQKNTLSPLIVGARARNIPENCGTPSAWSNEISRYYGTVSSSSSILSATTSTSNYNNELPLNEYYSNSDNNLYIETVDLYEWLDYKFSNRNLNKEEVEKIINFINNERSFKNVKVQIYNLNGIKLFDKSFKQGSHIINLSYFDTGIYIIKYEYGKIVDTKTIIVE